MEIHKRKANELRIRWNVSLTRNSVKRNRSYCHGYPNERYREGGQGEEIHMQNPTKPQKSQPTSSLELFSMSIQEAWLSLGSGPR